MARTLVFQHEMARWVEAGVQFFRVHSDPFLRAGLRRMRDLANGRPASAQPPVGAS